jgi:hypothetical protein
MILRCVPGLLAAALLSGPAARADVTLWFNGNYDGRDAVVNESGTGPGNLGYDGRIYDDFIVPVGQTWTIRGVFSNDALGATPATAAWEIRTGVSAGNSGTLVASGDGTDSLTDTGQKVSDGLITLHVYQNLVSGLSVTLGPGTYWLSVAPDLQGDASGAQSFITSTSGSGAIGQPPGNDGNSFFTSNFTGDNFTPANVFEGDPDHKWDYSLGVVGIVVPEPATWRWAVAGLVTAAGAVYRRRRAARS